MNFNSPSRKKKSSYRQADKRPYSPVFHNPPLPESRGFVLAYAVLVAGILLSVGIGIFSITLKEIILSRYGRESQIALAVADTGIECALFADFQLNNVFATSSESTSGGSVQCGGGEVSVTFVEPRTSTSATSTFATDFGDKCVFVEVGKYESGDRTTINSRGYNTGNAADECTGTDNAATRVERGLRLSY